VFSPTLVNSIRFSFTRTNERAQTIGETPGLNLIGAGRQDATISAGGITNPIGPTGTVPYFLIQNKFTVGDDFSCERRPPNIHAGASLVRVQTNLSAPVGG